MDCSVHTVFGVLLLEAESRGHEASYKPCGFYRLCQAAMHACTCVWEYFLKHFAAFSPVPVVILFKVYT